MNSRTLGGLVALVIAAFGSWTLSRLGEPDAEGTPAIEPIVQGYYLNSARIFGTGPDGALIYEILAERAVQQEDERVTFTDVRLRYAPSTNVPWSVDADNAVIDPAKPVIELSGHVRAISSEGFQGNDTEIRTDRLEIDPEAYVARTDERVQIRIGARSLTATGMLASLQENRLQLQSNISGKFAP